MNVGAELMRARHFRGLSIGEISNRTKIRRETLSAIEDNRVEDLSALDLRGALRAYAAEIQLDPDDVIERYHLSLEEFNSWQRAVDRSGMQGLRVTRTQHYRDLYERRLRYG